MLFQTTLELALMLCCRLHKREILAMKPIALFQHISLSLVHIVENKHIECSQTAGRLLYYLLPYLLLQCYNGANGVISTFSAC